MSHPIRASLAGALLCSLTACGDPQGWYDYVLVTLEGSTQTTSPNPPPKAYRDLHSRAPAIIDMHADTLVVHPEDKYLDRLLVNEERTGHVDVPRLIEANVALQVFAAYSKGSLDIIGNVAKGITGTYVDEDGEEWSRYDYVRDPDVPEYGDPNDEYDDDYSAIGMPRDVATYAFRLSRQGSHCETWYDEQPWDETLWGQTPSCPNFDFDRMYVERLLDVARRFDAADAIDDRLRKVTSAAELDALIAARDSNRNLVGGLLSTEGLYFRSDISSAAGEQRLRGIFAELYQAGFRMFALTHFIDNDHGGSATGMGKASHGEGGRPTSAAGMLFAELTLDGHAVLDVAHASPATIGDLVALASARQRPLVYSHGGLQNAPQTESDSCATSRNLSDSLVVDIASTGGVVGLGFSEDFVCGIKPIAWAAAVRHAVDVIDQAAIRRFHDESQPVLDGVDHVGLGTDYDGGIKAYTDVANLNQYTEALTCKKDFWHPNCLSEPFTEAEAHKILGGNTLRVLREALAP